MTIREIRFRQLFIQLLAMTYINALQLLRNVEVSQHFSISNKEVYIIKGPLQRFFSQNLKIKHKEGDELAISAKSAQPIQQIQTPIQFGDTEELLHKQPKSLSPPAPFKDIDIEQGDVGAPASRPRTTQPNDQQKHNDESKKYGANFLVVSRSKPTLSRQLDEAPASHGLKLPSTLRPAVGNRYQSNS